MFSRHVVPEFQGMLVEVRTSAVRVRATGQRSMVGPGATSALGSPEGEGDER